MKLATKLFLDLICVILSISSEFSINNSNIYIFGCMECSIIDSALLYHFFILQKIIYFLNDKYTNYRKLMAEHDLKRF